MQCRQRLQFITGHCRGILFLKRTCIWKLLFLSIDDFNISYSMSVSVNISYVFSVCVLVISNTRALPSLMVCNAPLSCKAYGVGNRLGACRLGAWVSIIAATHSITLLIIFCTLLQVKPTVLIIFGSFSA